jgi:hypothetical protein
MRYVVARAHCEDRDEAYRIYVAESLRALTGLKKGYRDLLDDGVEETRTSEEIVSSISDKLSRIGGD